MSDHDDDLGALAALVEPLRRRLYLHVVAQPVPVSREAAAAAVGVPRSAAAFHLDKLAELGLLDVEYRRPAGRGGPGAGRPAKLYRRSTKEFSFSSHERRYNVAASLLARALLDAGDQGVPPAEALAAEARAYGRALAAEVGDGRSASSGELFERLAKVLSDHGYEPRLEDGVVTLANCPFHALAEEHRELVCHMNLDVIAGLLEALGVSTAAARFDPAPGRCCVCVRAG